MSTILDARPQFLDSVGVRLSLGRLVIYKASTTTLADVWLDNEHTVPALNPHQLTDAGWTDQQLFVNEAVTVHVQDHLNADVKIYDLYQDGTIAVFGSSILVDTIADLADVALPVDGMTVQVKGYYSAHDLFMRTYIFDAISTATPDGGAIIGSNVQPTGRWLLANESGEVDAGVWGVLAGVASVNSQLRAAQEFCALRGLVLRISKGLYTLVGGGDYTSDCQLNAADGVSFVCTGGLYEWTIRNPQTTISDTLAGAGVKLIIDGIGWENTEVPATAFNATERGYDEGSAKYKLRITSEDQLIFNNACSFSSIDVDAGITAVIACDASVSIDTVSGLIDWTQSSNYPAIHDLRTSTATTDVSAGALMAKCTGVVTLDSIAKLSGPSAIVTAYVNAIGAGALTIDGRGGIPTLAGGFGGKPRFILNGLNSGTSPVSGEYFTAGSIVSAYNISPNSPPILDLKGLAATGNITRNGKILNGSLTGYINCGSIICEDLTVNGNITVDNVKLFRVTVNHSGNAPVNGMTSSVFRDVVLTSTASTAMQAHFADWENVTYNKGIISVGGESHLKNVSCDSLTIRPDAGGLFRDFTYDGGSITTKIVYDAANGAQSGTAIMYNTSIKRVTGLANSTYYDDLVLNGATKKWLVNGHYNIDVSENENGPSTKGSYSFPLTFVEADSSQASALFYIQCFEKMLFLGPNSTAEYLTNCEISGDAYKSGDMKRTYATGFIHAEMGRLSARVFYVGIKQNRTATSGTYTFAYPTHVSTNWRLYK